MAAWGSGSMGAQMHPAFLAHESGHAKCPNHRKYHCKATDPMLRLTASAPQCLSYSPGGTPRSTESFDPKI
jgi:hypothetical protein